MKNVKIGCETCGMSAVTVAEDEVEIHTSDCHDCGGMESVVAVRNNRKESDFATEIRRLDKEVPSLCLAEVQRSLRGLVRSLDSGRVSINEVRKGA